MKKVPAVYILANRKHGVLYVGVTSHLLRRIRQHKLRVYKGFTCKYNVHCLVFYEFHATMIDAIQREKQLKRGTRAQKITLIEHINPEWHDLYPMIIGTHDHPIPYRRNRRRRKEMPRRPCRHGMTAP